MRVSWRHGLALPIALMCSGTVCAQPEPITVAVNGTPVDTVVDGGAIDINIGAITGEVLVHIYDNSVSGGAPVSNLGSVTIRGSAGSTGSPRLSVLVAGQFDGFPGTPEQPINNGVLDFGGGPTGGLFIIDNDPSGRDLRDVTRLAMAVSGDVTGTIEVGQVFRLQAFGRVENTVYAGGNVHANITARAFDDDSAITNDEAAIAFIHAGNAITGDIIATGQIQAGTGAVLAGSISQIRVGVEANNDGGSPAQPAAVGITGDIRAELGHIGLIYSEGSVGVSASEQSAIWAGDGIDQIRIVQIDQSGFPAGVLKRNVSANVQANRLAVTHPAQFSYDDPRRDGTLHLLETDGDFTGNIIAGNITGSNEVFLVRYGVFVRGSIDLPAGSQLTDVIDIGLNLHYANIVAGAINAPVTIGRMAKGAIVAVGRADDPNTIGVDESLPGYIESIDIGNDGWHQDDAGRAIEVVLNLGAIARLADSPRTPVNGTEIAKPILVARRAPTSVPPSPEVDEATDAEELAEP